MRKLIEELQTEIERRGLKEAALEGLFLALQIVKAHNPWYEIEKDGLPEPNKLLWFLCRDRSVFLGYYESFIEDGELCYLWSVLNCMIYREGNEIVVESVFDDDYDVTHYRYIATDLPEVKP